MKTLLLKLLLIAFLFNACSSSDSVTEVVPENPCASVSDLSVIQQGGSLTFTITSTSTPTYYEISYLPAGSENNPQYGTKKTLTTLSETNSLYDLGISPGNVYLFYARAVCSDDSRSAWTAPKSVTINAFCPDPYDLGIGYYNFGVGFDWSSEYSPSAAHYQVQYGIQGFTLGNGTVVTTNSTYYDAMPMSANTTYDFYVRSFCSTSLGWSSWVGPYSYFSATNQNLCSVPTNLSYNIESYFTTTTAVNFHWAYNGEINFEYKVVRSGSIVVTSTIGTSGTPTVILPKNATYQVFVRAICSSGTPTAWSTPLSFSI